MLPEIVIICVLITSFTGVNSSRLTEYSRKIWKPRRATFSVRIERFIRNTLTQYAEMHATSSAGKALALRVSSSANRIAVNGMRIMPARIAHMPSSGHSSGSLPGKIIASRPPSPAPSASNGASTPPEVPEPR